MIRDWEWEYSEREKYLKKNKRFVLSSNDRFYNSNDESDYRIIEDLIIYEIYNKHMTIEDLKKLFYEYSAREFDEKRNHFKKFQITSLESVQQIGKITRHCEAMKNLLSFHIIKQEEKKGEKE